MQRVGKDIIKYMREERKAQEEKEEKGKAVWGWKDEDKGEYLAVQRVGQWGTHIYFATSPEWCKPHSTAPFPRLTPTVLARESFKEPKDKQRYPIFI